jgi:uracil phosphoribosyltransferase
MAAMAMSLRVVVPPHPLIAHWLTILRDASTPPPLFSTALVEMGRWLSYEAVRDWLPQRQIGIQTPLAETQGQVVDGNVPLLSLPLLPAGLGLWEGARSVLPVAAIAPMQWTQFNADGCSEDGHSHHAVLEVETSWRWIGLPERIGERVGVLVFVAELASAQPLLALLRQLRQLGVKGQRLRIITTVASAPGLKSLGEAEPDLTLYCACIDADLDAEGRIVPGFGDASRRFSGIDGVTCLG